MPASGERSVIFDECHRRGDRCLVGGEDLCACRFVGECPLELTRFFAHGVLQIMPR
jgi:hypothetical protein